MQFQVIDPSLYYAYRTLLFVMFKHKGDTIMIQGLQPHIRGYGVTPDADKYLIRMPKLTELAGASWS